jgi:hypothetical protein
MPRPPVRTVALIDDDRCFLTSLVNLLASGGYGTRAYESDIQVLERTVHSDSPNSSPISQANGASIRKTTIFREAQ